MSAGEQRLVTEPRLREAGNRAMHVEFAREIRISPPIDTTRLIIAGGTLRVDALRDQVAVVTGGGNGIGVEAARALLWLGAKVVIADIDAGAALASAARLAADWGDDRIVAVATDVADAAAVERLVSTVLQTHGSLDIVLNNATFAPVGDATWETPITDWDRSYAVNLRAPALLARATIPRMVAQGHGVFACVSSVGGPYQAAYESVKAAQVALAYTLDAELTGMGVHAFTIGPGLVPTETAITAVRRLVPRLGMTGAEFLSLTRATLLSVEAAGAGFAAAIAMADRYAGQEVSSTQALIDAGIELPDEPPDFPIEGLPASRTGVTKLAVDTPAPAAAPPAAASADAQLALVRRVRATLSEQAEGWRRRSFFERQWMLRDFKQRAGMPVEGWLEWLGRLEGQMESGRRDGSEGEYDHIARLVAYYDHLGELARGYVKDATQREEQLRVVAGWRSEVDDLAAALAVSPP